MQDLIALSESPLLHGQAGPAMSRRGRHRPSADLAEMCCRQHGRSNGRAKETALEVMKTLLCICICTVQRRAVCCWQSIKLSEALPCLLT